MTNRRQIMTTTCIPVPVSAAAIDDLGWLSLSCDAGGANTHKEQVTYLGVTPDDFGSHDPDGTDLGWISLEPARLNGYKA